MASKTGAEATLDQLSQFQIFPRQTIRAAIRTFDYIHAGEIHVTDDEFEIIKELWARAIELLKGGSMTWPLNVQVGSCFWDFLYTLVLTAKLLHIHHTIKSNIAHYLKPLPVFFDDRAEVDEDGFLVGPEVIVLTQMLSKKKKLSTKTMLSKEKMLSEKKKGKRQYEYYDTGDIENDDGARQEFDLLVEAAIFKSEMFPVAGARTALWRKYRDTRLAKAPDMLLEVAMIHLEHDRHPEPAAREPSNENHVGEENDISGTSRKILTTDTEALDIMPTLADIRESSPSPADIQFQDKKNDDKHSDARDTGLRTTYTAVLEARNEKVTFDIDPIHISGPENFVLEGTRTMWTSLAEKGVVDRFTLQELVKLTKDIMPKEKNGADIHG